MNERLVMRIKELRHTKKLTQEQVADQIDISRQKYAGIERGECSISLVTLSKIANVLGVSVGEITNVLDEPAVVTHKTGEESGSSKKIFDMLDLFYANKRMCARLQYRD